MAELADRQDDFHAQASHRSKMEQQNTLLLQMSLGRETSHTPEHQMLAVFIPFLGALTEHQAKGTEGREG